MTDTNPEDFFLSGKVAMFQNGSWAAIAYADNDDIGDKVTSHRSPRAPRATRA